MQKYHSTIQAPKGLLPLQGNSFRKSEFYIQPTCFLTFRRIKSTFARYARIHVEELYKSTITSSFTTRLRFFHKKRIVVSLWNETFRSTLRIENRSGIENSQSERNLLDFIGNHYKTRANVNSELQAINSMSYINKCVSWTM